MTKAQVLANLSSVLILGTALVMPPVVANASEPTEKTLADTGVTSWPLSLIAFVLLALGFGFVRFAKKY
ncbi:MAG: hypothetical protein EBS85_01985 [Micrococcales bacterium]|jgi:hypothetical protein|nr:hypothetical protein [Actinomycetota bacterium]NCA07489.1 hypothetical protein [Micrococcales bacterium]